MSADLPRRPMGRFDLALLPCTRGKNKGGLTARTLYKGAVFSTGMRHAAMTAERTMIMSAKYGLLNPEDRVQFYEAYLPALPPAERAALLLKIKAQARPLLALGRIISYLPKEYHLALLEAEPGLGAIIERPFGHLGMIKLVGFLAKEVRDGSSSACR